MFGDASRSQGEMNAPFRKGVSPKITMGRFTPANSSFGGSERNSRSVPDSAIAQLYAEEVSIRVVLDRFVFAFFVNAGVTLFPQVSKLQALRLIFEFGESAGLERVIFFHPRHSLPAAVGRVRAAAATGHVASAHFAWTDVCPRITRITLKRNPRISGRG